MQRAIRTISQLHLAVQRGLHEQQISGINACIAQMSDLQQLAAAAMSASSSSASSSCCWAGQWQGAGSVRCMAGRTHKLSLKRENNKASRLAVAPFLQQQDQQQRQLSPVIKTGIPPLPVLEEPAQYQRIGKMTGPYSVGAQPCFAVVESGGCQWKVTADDVIYHNKIRGVRVNDVLQFNKVLLLGTHSETTIGRPFVPGATVVAAVEETFKDAKVYVFKKKVRKRYSKLMGHRSHITALRILEVRHPQPTTAAAAALEPNEAAAGGGALANVAPIGRSSTAFEAQRQQLVSEDTAAAASTAAAQQVEATSAPSDTADQADQADQAAAAASDRSRLQQSNGPGEPDHTRAHGPAAVLDATGRL